LEVGVSLQRTAGREFAYPVDLRVTGEDGFGRFWRQHCPGCTEAMLSVTDDSREAACGDFMGHLGQQSFVNAAMGRNVLISGINCARNEFSGFENV
jgi:hypothetical protein